MSKFNKSHLNNQFTLKILKACYKAMSQGIDHVFNKKGACVLAVRFVNNKFIITDINDKTISIALLTKYFNSKAQGVFNFVTKRVDLKEF